MQEACGGERGDRAWLILSRPCVWRREARDCGRVGCLFARVLPCLCGVHQGSVDPVLFLSLGGGWYGIALCSLATFVPVVNARRLYFCGVEEQGRRGLQRCPPLRDVRAREVNKNILVNIGQHDAADGSSALRSDQFVRFRQADRNGIGELCEYFKDHNSCDPFIAVVQERGKKKKKNLADLWSRSLHISCQMDNKGLELF